MKLKLVVDGRTYEVEVEVEEPEQPIYGVGGYIQMSPARIPAPPPIPVSDGTFSDRAGEGKVCRSPISGIVVQVKSQAGQQIQEGDTLIVLEAMKMETDITASANGKIRAVNVKTGESVRGGQVLIEFE
jgi:biotin carboxyl carrier protein